MVSLDQCVAYLSVQPGIGGYDPSSLGESTGLFPDLFDWWTQKVTDTFELKQVDDKWPHMIMWVCMCVCVWNSYVRTKTILIIIINNNMQYRFLAVTSSAKICYNIFKITGSTSTISLQMYNKNIDLRETDKL